MRKLLAIILLAVLPCGAQQSSDCPFNVDYVLDQIYTQMFLPDSMKICLGPCRGVNLDSIGIRLSYQIHNLPEVYTPWIRTSDSTYCASIPHLPAGTLVSYWVVAKDSDGSLDSTIKVVIRVVTLSQNGYLLDTASTSGWVELDTSGTKILPSDWFLRPGAEPNLFPQDDETAGPFDLGNPFNFFGSEVRYAWVGVNGAIALTDAPTDTIHLNNNNFCFGIDIPRDSPRNLVSPFWNDLALVPAKGGRGSIYYQSDETRFVVEWDSVGKFGDSSGAFASFEVILDRRDSSVVFSYKNVQSGRLDSNAIVGMAADTTRWFSLYSGGSPPQLTPRNGKVFKLKPDIVVGVNEKRPITPKSLVLHQNYPNPFNPTTTINYDLPQPSFVTLKIFNILGQEIQTLVNAKQGAGNHTVEFNSATLPSGVYFYKLTANNFIQVKKMLLLR